MKENKNLNELFAIAIKATIVEDKGRDNSFLHLILENKTFTDRVFANFLIVASAYHTKEEIKCWVMKEFESNSN